jgi:hypothetical protein
MCCSHLGICVYKSGTRLALCHPCAIKNVQHILPLREEFITATLNMYTKEVMQFTKVLHSELVL